MGIFNRIVTIFILLAAAAAAVFSYFLFEKRTQMLQGWDVMAQEINATAKMLDVNSGTAVASKLSSSDLHHRNSISDLQGRARALRDAAGKIIQQRDTLAQAIVDVSTKLDVPASELNVAQLQSVGEFEAEKEKVLQSAEDIRVRNEAILANFVKLGSQLAVTGTESEIKNDSGDAFTQELVDKVQAKDTRISTYETNLRSIAKLSNGPELNNAEDSYSDSVANVTDGVRKQGELLKQTEEKLVLSKDEIKALTETKAALEGEIASQKEEIAARDEKIVDLRFKLNPSQNAEIDAYIFGPKNFRQLYALVQGNVKKIDKNWNFVVVDLGKFYTANQVVAGRNFSSLLIIPPNAPMTIVRGLGTSNPKFIAKVMVTEVHNNYAVANIESCKDKIKEGDVAIYLNEDIDKLLKELPADFLKDSVEAKASAEAAAAVVKKAAPAAEDEVSDEEADEEVDEELEEVEEEISETEEETEE